MPDKHALLSASSSHRWLACPPSAVLCAQEADQPGPYAREGTDAHTLCEHKVLKYLGRDSPDPRENLDYFNEEMDSCSDQYCSFVAEQLEEARRFCKDPEVLVEQRLDFSKWVPEGFGTGDCLIVADKLLHIIDFKYGMGVLVEAENNPQMMCYALGALDIFDGLLNWAESTLMPAAKLAYKGEGEFCAGDHCQFCKVKATCRKRAEYNLELARYDFPPPATLNDLEIAAILPRLENLVCWANDIREYALQQALSGTEFPGFKVVEGRSVRKFIDESEVAAIVSDAGFDPYEKKVLGITAMTTLLGKKRFEELLSGMITKPPGKPTLVPESDKRPALNTAKNDFSE